MTTSTKEGWQAIMKLHAAYSGTTKQFCDEHNIPQQSMYARRHSMGLSNTRAAKRAPVLLKMRRDLLKRNFQHRQARLYYRPIMHNCHCRHNAIHYG